MPQDDIRGDLDPGISPGEAEALERLGRELRDQRPVPRAAFRAALRRRLLVDAAPAGVERPRRVRLLIASYASVGAALLAFAGFGVFGAGPLAA